MAELLDEFPGRKKGSGRQRLYPWADWLDGRVWKLTRGLDFAAGRKLADIASSAAGAAKRAGLKVRTTRPDGANGDTIVLQAYPAETPVEALGGERAISA